VYQPSLNVPVLTRTAGRLLLWAGLLLAMVPVLFIVVTAFKPEGLARTSPPTWVFTPTLDNFGNVLHAGDGTSVTFGRLLMNSALISVGAVLLTLVVAVPAAYGLSLRGFRAARKISNWVLSTYLFPPIVAVIPVFVFGGDLGLTDRYPILIVPYAAFNMPIAVWIIRTGIDAIPYEIQEAALIDGARPPQILWEILRPLLMPSIATAGIISLILTWNEFLFALSLTRAAAKTSPVGVMEFTGLYGTQWGPLAAASFMIAAPMIVIALVMRRRIVSGLTFGAVK
jgi:ABC-type glycerol-3-phosphate transport system permease component